MKTSIWAACALLLGSSAFAAEDIEYYKTDLPLNQMGAMPIIAKIFSQNVLYFIPEGFMPVLNQKNSKQYIVEYVPPGESKEQWTQMITLSAGRDLAEVPQATPEAMARRIAEGFQKDCPDSFSGTTMGASKFSGYDAYALEVSCGVSNPTGPAFSEKTIAIAIKGSKDVYVIQWAERGAASKTPMPFDFEKFKSRSSMLMPIRLCDVSTGGKTPYDGCLVAGSAPAK